MDTPDSSPSDGAPSRTASGAPKRSAGACVISRFDRNGDGKLDALTPMTVLAPQDNTTTTLDPHPTLFIYLPQTAADTAELVIDELIPRNDPDQRYSYHEILFQDNLPVPATAATGPRIARYQIEEVRLEPGKVYHWQFSVLCNGSTPENGTVEGLITCENGCTASIGNPDPDVLFWNEEIRTTAQDRKANPDTWHELLESQGLKCFEDVPFADDLNATYTLDNDPQCFVD
ncbi:MAG: DUF928 domain-containing protein [Spirulina sp. SIO3F2]|nr:DUF928 domain-containing protein [Spirulina sp. SIO3F2]